MAKRTKQQIENRFDKLEKQLIALLEVNQLKIESEDDGKVIKSKIKKYQSNLSQIIDKFREYEQLCDELLKIEKQKLGEKNNDELLVANEEKKEIFEEKVVVEGDNVRTERKKREKSL